MLVHTKWIVTDTRPSQKSTNCVLCRGADGNTIRIKMRAYWSGCYLAGSSSRTTLCFVITTFKKMPKCLPSWVHVEDDSSMQTWPCSLPLRVKFMSRNLLSSQKDEVVLDPATYAQLKQYMMSTPQAVIFQSVLRRRAISGRPMRHCAR
jgi:hypothetical protein